MIFAEDWNWNRKFEKLEGLNELVYFFCFLLLYTTSFHTYTELTLFVHNVLCIALTSKIVFVWEHSYLLCAYCPMHSHFENSLFVDHYLEETNPPGMTQLNSGGSRQDVDGDQTDDDNRNPRLLGNGDISKPLELSVRDSNSEHCTGRVCILWYTK